MSPTVLTTDPITWAQWLEDLCRRLLLLDYTTRMVVLSTSALGLAAGLIGSFLLLRKRSLMGDALSHACLPGITLAFFVLVSLGLGGHGQPLPLPGLLAGATLTGVLGMAMVVAIRNTTHLKDDAAMGIVLSVFYGLGVVGLSLAQQMETGGQAGLTTFIYGNTASIVMQDLIFIGGTATAVTLLCGLLLKEFTLLCFDEGFAAAKGWPVRSLDALMLALVAAVTVVGLNSVGLILIVAFLIIPAAAARFWTQDIRRMLVLSGIIGAVSGWLGATLSAMFASLPAGAVIVLVAATLFALSMLFGPARGVVRQVAEHRRLVRKVGRQHLLRAVYEILEAQCGGSGQQPPNVPIDVHKLQAHRSWSPRQLRRLIRTAQREDHIDFYDGRTLRLSEAGFGEAARTTRNHRLWEMFLIRHAELAPSHVDRDADAVEHVLDPEMVRQLEKDLLQHRGGSTAGPAGVPPSPHPVAPATLQNT